MCVASCTRHCVHVPRETMLRMRTFVERFGPNACPVAGRYKKSGRNVANRRRGEGSQVRRDLVTPYTRKAGLNCLPIWGLRLTSRSMALSACRPRCDDPVGQRLGQRDTNHKRQRSASRPTTQSNLQRRCVPRETSRALPVSPTRVLVPVGRYQVRGTMVPMTRISPWYVKIDFSVESLKLQSATPLHCLP